MAAYTQAIEMHIAKTLDLRGFVTAQMLPGVDEIEAGEVLRRYAELHSQEQALDFDGKELRLVRPAAVVQTEALPEHPRSGSRWFVVAGVVAIAAIALMFVGFGRAGVRHSTSWPASPDGRAALYYFGTST